MNAISAFFLSTTIEVLLTKKFSKGDFFMNKDWDLIQKTIDYSFDNVDLLQQAFVRRSYSEEKGGENNEVLEFIGDKALDLVVMKVIMKKYGNITNGDYQEFKTKYDEGKFTEIKRDLVEGKALAKCIDKLGFQNYLILGKGDQKQNVAEEDSVKEDLFEAIVGAVTIDSDWDLDAIEGVVKMMIDFNSFFNGSIFEDDLDFISEIQQWTQKKYNELPDYSFEETYNGYRCRLDLEGVNQYFYGEGRSKSGARFLAAKEAYEFLDYNDMLYDMKDEVGEADYDRCINQLQELAQKGYINEPEYDYHEEKDYNGNSIWVYSCSVPGYDIHFENESTKKQEAKRMSAYEMLVYILDGTTDDEN